MAQPMNPDSRRDEISSDPPKAILPPRSRPAYAVAILLVIALGLLSRRFPESMPAALGKTPGDALWALMVFLGFGFVFRSSATGVVALAALAFSFAIECSQLYHAPWIDTARGTLPGRLVLGSDFAWGDLVAYTVGVGVGAIAEMGVSHFRQRWQTGQ
jgi:hypothetical protein